MSRIGRHVEETLKTGGVNKFCIEEWVGWRVCTKGAWVRGRRERRSRQNRKKNVAYKSALRVHVTDVFEMVWWMYDGRGSVIG